MFLLITWLYVCVCAGSSKLSGPQELSRCLKLIDEHNQWCEQASEVQNALYNPDFDVMLT